MHRTGVRRGTPLALAVSLALGAVLALTGHVGSRSPVRPVAAHRWVVRPGDTLWSIAGRYQPSGDRRALVDAIQRANRVDPGSLDPGEALVVPIQP